MTSDCLQDGLSAVCLLGQGAGKSSVLEAIVGLDCLPRNVNIATRRPLLLKLQAQEPASEGQEARPKAVLQGESFGVTGQADFERPWPGTQTLSVTSNAISTIPCIP